MSSNHSRSHSNHLGMETLESRTMLAGDVAVAIVDGDLFVSGDEAANHIVMTTDVNSGALLIDGRALDGAPTTINGQQGPVIIEGFENSIRMDMRAGDDLVRIPRGDFSENVWVGMGRGADRLVLGPDPNGPPVESRSVNVEGNLRLGLGRGSDSLRATAVSSGSMNVLGDTGADDIGLNALHVSRRLRIGTGQGNDRIGISDLRSHHLEVHTGFGHDALTVLDSTFARFDARMGAGNDRVRVGFSAVGAATIGGGEGRDTFVNLGENHANHFALYGFERILTNEGAGSRPSANPLDLVSLETDADDSDERPSQNYFG